MQIDGGLGADPAGQEGLASLTADMVDEGTGHALRHRCLGRAGAHRRGVRRRGRRRRDDVHADDAGAVCRTRRAAAVGHPDGAVDARVRLRAGPAASSRSTATAQRSAARGRRARVPSASVSVASRTDIWRSAATPRCARSHLEEVVRFHAATFLPWRATLVVAGALSHAELVAIADEAFGGWTGEEHGCRISHSPRPMSLRCRFVSAPRDHSSRGRRAVRASHRPSVGAPRHAGLRAACW